MGLKQEDFAEIIHVSKVNYSKKENGIDISKSNISKYEAGSVEPNLDIITKSAVYFSIPTDYLLGLSDKRIDKSDYEWKLPLVQNRLGSILFKFREREKLSTGEFAQKMGISESLETELEQEF